ncbi:unnamed protein product [Sphenostylis stenocarpa]|uniref:Uncharacterized protein n=1 Tax=Sphenostylis stenocarpa TaxID=92480 RepID=A0AA86VQG8_9FABA|nr:unnamed protein product [Sphenostylis stenocarpa]
MMAAVIVIVNDAKGGRNIASIFDSSHIYSYKEEGLVDNNEKTASLEECICGRILRVKS